MTSSNPKFRQPIVGGFLSVADSINRYRTRARSSALSNSNQARQAQTMRNRKGISAARNVIFASNSRSKYKGRSRTRTRTYTRKRKNNKFSKRSYYKRKRYVKKQVKKFRKYVSLTQPYETYTTNFSENWVSTGWSAYGNSNVTSVDVGLCRFTTAPTLGNFDTTYDDLSYAINKAYGINSTPDAELYDGRIYFDKVRATTCLRNNTNIGVHVDVYYCKRKANFTATGATPSVLMSSVIQYQMENSVTPTDADLYKKMGLASSIFDYPSVCSKLTFKKHSSFILYPAQTRTFKIRSPIEGKIVNIATNFVRTASPKWHRSLVFVTRGLPVHKSDTADFTSGPVAYGANAIDVLVSRKLKFRKPVLQEQDEGFVPITAITPISFANQEIMPAVNPSNVIVAS
jgi:hypothetical protein